MSQDQPALYPVVASIFIPQGSSGGGVVTKGDGCIATGAGVAGQYQITLNEAIGQNSNLSDCRIIVTLGTGTAIGGGVSYGLSLIDNLNFGLQMFKVADQTHFDASVAVTILQRVPGFREGI